MHVEDVEIIGLAEDPHNARVHNERNLKAIKNSLTTFGQVEPLVVRRGTNVVIGGNGRLAAMRDLGWEKAHVSYQDLTDSQAAALGIALNRTAELATWDEDQLAVTIEELRSAGESSTVELENIGFDTKELEKISVSAHNRAAAGQTGEETSEQLGDGMTYSVIVDFDNEEGQGKLLAELEGKGHSCRLLIA